MEGGGAGHWAEIASDRRGSGTRQTLVGLGLVMVDEGSVPKVYVSYGSKRYLAFTWAFHSAVNPPILPREMSDLVGVPGWHRLVEGVQHTSKSASKRQDGEEQLL